MKKFTCLLLVGLAVLTGCKKDKAEGEDAAVGATQDSTVVSRYERKNANSPEALADLEALDKAIAIMKKKGCDDPLSWYYQGAIHWIPDTIVGKNKLCADYQNYTNLKDAWDNCTHTDAGTEEIHFLAWHRMYIYHFERIVRKLSGKQDFALPYWGYTDTTDVDQNRTMPARFRDKKSALYQSARFDSLLNGQPINGKITRKLDLTALNENTTYALFNQTIDAAPHGAMHNYIGYGNVYTPVKSKYNEIWQKNTDGMMAEVPTAGFDPIFWLHHSNIDRIWQQWTNSANGQQVTLAELKSVPWAYTFFDENGEKVTYSMEDVIKVLYTMDYDFDDTKVEPKKVTEAPLVFSTKSYSKGDTLSISSQKVSLGRDVKISLPNRKGTGVKLFSQQNKKGELLILSVTVSFAKAPKGDFEVYLNLPTNVKATPDNDHFAGFMTFFGANHTHNRGGRVGSGRKTKTFNFDITDEALDTNAMGKQTFDVSILKFDGAPAEDIKIEKISVLKQ